MIESENDHSFNEILFEKDLDYYGVFENIDDNNIKLYETSGNEKIKKIYHGPIESI